MELRSWRRKAGSPDLIEGVAYNDTRGLYDDREYCVICPDKANTAVEDLGDHFRIRVTDKIGVVYFRLDKHEEDKSG